MRVFLPDLYARKRVLRELATKHPAWKRKVIFSILLFSVGIVIIAFTLRLIMTNTPRALGYFIFGVPGATFAIIPMIIGVIRYVSAKYDCALPYSSYANGTITLYEDRLEYVYWEIRKESPEAKTEKYLMKYPEEAKTTYSIDRDSIRDVTTEDGLVCVISGSAKIKIPDWKRKDGQFFLDKTQYVGEFSFPLAFAETDVIQIIDNWRR